MSKSLKRNNTKSFFKRSRKNKLGGSGLDLLSEVADRQPYMPIKTPIRRLNTGLSPQIYTPGDDVWAMTNLGSFIRNVPPEAVGAVLVTFAIAFQWGKYSEKTRNDKMTKTDFINISTYKPEDYINKLVKLSNETSKNLNKMHKDRKQLKKQLEQKKNTLRRLKSAKKKLDKHRTKQISNYTRDIEELEAEVEEALDERDEFDKELRNCKKNVKDLNKTLTETIKNHDMKQKFMKSNEYKKVKHKLPQILAEELDEQGKPETKSSGWFW